MLDALDLATWVLTGGITIIAGAMFVRWYTTGPAWARKRREAQSSTFEFGYNWAQSEIRSGGTHAIEALDEIVVGKMAAGQINNFDQGVAHAIIEWRKQNGGVAA